MRKSKNKESKWYFNKQIKSDALTEQENTENYVGRKTWEEEENTDKGDITHI